MKQFIDSITKDIADPKLKNAVTIILEDLWSKHKGSKKKILAEYKNHLNAIIAKRTAA